MHVNDLHMTYVKWFGKGLMVKSDGGCAQGLGLRKQKEVWFFFCLFPSLWYLMLWFLDRYLLFTSFLYLPVLYWYKHSDCNQISDFLMVNLDNEKVIPLSLWHFILFLLLIGNIMWICLSRACSTSQKQDTKNYTSFNSLCLVIQNFPSVHQGTNFFTVYELDNIDGFNLPNVGYEFCPDQQELNWYYENFL